MTAVPGGRAAAPADARGATARLRAAWGRTSLRVRLVAGMLVLVALALVGSGAVAAATLRGYLVQRVDDQLRGAAGAMLHEQADGDRPLGGGGDADGGDGGRLPSQFVREVLTANGRPVGGTLSNLVDSSEELPDFPHLTVAQARAQAGEPFTVGSADDGERWRVVAVPLPDGSGTLLVASGLGDVSATVARLETIELGIGLGTLVLAALAGGLLVRTALRPLREVEDTASAIAAGDLSRRVADDDPRTEVGRLGSAFNTMLTRIEESFRARAASEEEARRSEERMRRFVADASHELRTPLTSIRGFAELHRLQRDAVAGTAVADVSRSMERIESEATRMGLLVEDLLLLARLDQERPLAREPVDLLAVAADVVHDSAARAPDRVVRLVAVPSDQPPVVAGDDARLRQVLTNLVDNALQHGPAGSPVEVRVGTAATVPGDGSGPTAVVEVVDHGRGLTATEKEHVFERFWRADASRNRADGGAGLGLAIVSALVTRHGGTVGVDDTPGGGATFRVRLPLQPA
jgi:two-component system OmpR family sensor kinase